MALIRQIILLSLPSLVYASNNLEFITETDGRIERLIINKNLKSLNVNSNRYSKTLNLKGIGLFNIKDVNPVYVERLQKIKKDINNYEKLLSKSKKSMLSLFPLKKHAPYIKFYQYNLSSQNPFYEKIFNATNAYLKNNTSLSTGINYLSPKVHEYKDGKLQKSYTLEKSKFCIGHEYEALCKLKKYYLYIP